MKNNQIIIYQTEDGKVKIETHFENETVWLNIDQIRRKLTTESRKLKKTLSSKLRIKLKWLRE